MVEASQKNVKYEGLPRFRNILVEKFEPLLDIEEVIRNNQRQKEAEEAAKRERDEFIKQTLYQQSLKLQESMRNLQTNVLGTALGVLGLSETDGAKFDLSKIGSTPKPQGSTQQVGKSEKPGNLEKSASSRILTKKVAIEDGIAKNFHVDYTGKMVYYDNQKYLLSNQGFTPRSTVALSSRKLLMMLFEILSRS